MSFLNAIDICSRDELIGHVAFLEEAWLGSALEDMFVMGCQRAWHFIKRKLGFDRRGTFESDDVGSLRLPSPLMKRMSRRVGELRELSDADLKLRFVRLIAARAEISSRRAGDEQFVERKVLQRCAQFKNIPTDLSSTENVERKLFVRYVVDHLSDLQRYFISVGCSDPEKEEKLIRDAIGGLSDPSRESVVQQASAEEVAERALSGLMHAGVIVGAFAVVWTLLLFGVYAAIALAAGLSGGLVLPAIAIGIIFVVNRRFNVSIMAFEAVLLYARVKRAEMEELRRGMNEPSAEQRKIAELKGYIEELHEMIKAYRRADVKAGEGKEAVLERATIVVLGEGHIGVRKLTGIAKERGLNARNLEFIGYEKLKRFNVERLRWGACDGILVGEVPHSARGAANANLIEALKAEGFPPVEVCREAGGDVKLTKKSFEDALGRLIERITGQASAPHNPARNPSR